MLAALLVLYRIKAFKSRHIDIYILQAAKSKAHRLELYFRRFTLWKLETYVHHVGGVGPPTSVL